MSQQLENFKNHFFKFIKNIKKTFPEYSDIIDNNYNNDTWGTLDDINLFYNKLVPYTTFITNTNEDLFLTNESLDFLQDINFVLLWKDKKLTDRSKQVLWKHLHTLLIIGNLINDKNIDELIHSININNS